ncbi:hypothetical protein ONS95_001389 [Cadophora gregata]|uniref:uncharacterized protein n=1 Tax=Cadophora gregata TaxID=51156 RepID=UPI0026DC190F|nr:uncharacterized protein ONS95_001389 [Cadophora gregata]KAK0111009.1 hypothetical protein ONS95_001389 [Cadophora gregata]KAK0112534.1 hypothetical protein ONS96_001770 [Cadophora gregata f. sp. sojae]
MPLSYTIEALNRRGLSSTLTCLALLPSIMDAVLLRLQHPPCIFSTTTLHVTTHLVCARVRHMRRTHVSRVLLLLSWYRLAFDVRITALVTLFEFAVFLAATRISVYTSSKL